MTIITITTHLIVLKQPPQHPYKHDNSKPTNHTYNKTHPSNSNNTLTYISNITKTTYTSYNTVHNFHTLMSMDYKNTPLCIDNSLFHLCIIRNLACSSYISVIVGPGTLLSGSLCNLWVFDNKRGSCRHMVRMCYLKRMNGNHNLCTTTSMCIVDNVMDTVYTHVCMYSVRNKSYTRNKSFYPMSIEYIVSACIIKLSNKFLY